jgi:hypothetical protein
MHNAQVILDFWAGGASTVDCSTTYYDGSGVDSKGAVNPSDCVYASLQLAYIKDFCSGGPLFDVINQYKDSSGPLGSCSAFGNAWYFSNNHYPEPNPVTLSDDDIEDQAIGVWQNLGSPANAVVAVFLPYDIGLCSNGLCYPQNGCGYHGWDSDNHIGYIAMADAGANPSRCLVGGSPNQDPFGDSEVSTLSHETDEAFTDPAFDGFCHGDSCNNSFGETHEIGDMCGGDAPSPEPDQSTVHLGISSSNYGAFYIQTEWSNSFDDGSPGGCTYDEHGAPTKVNVNLIADSSAPTAAQEWSFPIGYVEAGGTFESITSSSGSPSGTTPIWVTPNSYVHTYPSCPAVQDQGPAGWVGCGRTTTTQDGWAFCFDRDCEYQNKQVTAGYSSSTATTLTYHYYELFEQSPYMNLNGGGTPPYGAAFNYQTAPACSFDCSATNDGAVAGPALTLSTSPSNVFAVFSSTATVDGCIPLHNDATGFSSCDSSAPERWETARAPTCGYGSCTLSLTINHYATHNLINDNNWISGIDYYHQYKIGFQYSLGGSPTGSPAALPTVYYIQVGKVLTMGALPYPSSSDWVDATSSVQYDNPLSSSTSTERWIDLSVPRSQYCLGGTLPLQCVDTSIVVSSVSAATTINPTFTHQYFVSFAVSPAGGGSASPGDAWFTAGSATPISASANAGYTFNHWSSNSSSITLGSPSANPSTVTASDTGTVTANFTINTVITYSGGVSGEYSDPVAVQATLKDTFGNPLVGYNLKFTVGSQSVTAATGPAGVASTTLVLNDARGPYSVVVAFAGDSTYTGTSSSTPFTINPEPATASYTGMPTILTSSPPSSITTSAQVASELDDAPGNIALASVVFTIQSANCVSSCPTFTSPAIPVTTISAPGVGTASFSTSCAALSAVFPNFCTNQAVYIVTTRIAGNYYAGLDSYATLVVYTPSGQFTTGGGTIIDPNTGRQANFGWHVSYKSSGGIQGNMVYIYRGACATGVNSSDGLCDYMLKITSWTSGSLSFGSYNCAANVLCYATFQGKGVLQILDPVTGTLLYSQGNITSTIGAWDNRGTANNAGEDQLYLDAVYSQPIANSGQTSHQVGTVQNPVSLKGGVIIVHGT